MNNYEVADFLWKLTQDDETPWRTLPLRQVLEGKGRNVKHWLVATDRAPALALCHNGPEPVHIKSLKERTPPVATRKGKGKDSAPPKGARYRSSGKGQQRQCQAQP